MRDKEKLKREILQVLKDNKGTIISLDEMKQSLFVTNVEAASFKEAIKELERERRITMHITIS